MSRTWALLSVVVSAACFGTLAVLTPLAYRAGATPLPLLAWRFLFASLLLVTLVALRSPVALRVPRGDVLRFSSLALTGYGAASICYFFALQYATASVVAVLLYAYPALVTLASWVFLAERPSWQRIAAIVVTFAGCAMVVGLFGGDVYVKPLGIALGLGAAVGYTLFNLLSNRWLPGRSQLVMMAYTFGIAAIGTATVAFAVAIARGVPVAQLGGVLSPAAWQSRVWVLLAVIVVVPTFAAIVLYLEGIRGLGPAQAAVISTLEPLFTIALARVFLHEALKPMQFAGAALVLAGVVAAELSARATEPPPVV